MRSVQDEYKIQPYYVEVVGALRCSTSRDSPFLYCGIHHSLRDIGPALRAHIAVAVGRNSVIVASAINAGLEHDLNVPMMDGW